MLDSTTTSSTTGPLLSLADDSSAEQFELSSASHYAASSVSTRSDPARLERVEREVLSLARRLEQESQARRRLQELIVEAGVKLPADLIATD